MNFLRRGPMHLWPALIKINDATGGCFVRTADLKGDFACVRLADVAVI